MIKIKLDYSLFLKTTPSVIITAVTTTDSTLFVELWFLSDLFSLHTNRPQTIIAVDLNWPIKLP